MAPKKKRAAPRQATRWIGDAFVLDGDLLVKGAPAVWRGVDGSGKREPRCARVRITEMMRDWEFDNDEEPLHRAALQLSGESIVPRLATYREQDLVAIVDDDVGDVSLAELMRALRRAQGTAPFPLALAIAHQCAKADAAARVQGVALDRNPARIVLSWDGRVWLRPAVRPLGDDDEANDGPMDDDDEGLQRLLYGWRDMGIGAIAYELITGRHPFATNEERAAAAANGYGPPQRSEDEGEDDDESEDDDGDENDEDDENDENEDDLEDLDAGALAELVRDRLNNGTFAPIDDALDVPADVRDGVCSLLGAPQLGVALDRIASLVERHPFSARDLAGVLRSFFAARARTCALEREDRLLVMPHAKVEPEAWLLFADAPVDEDEELLDLDDVRRGHPDFRDGARYEPSVEAVDPFDDER